MKKLAIALTVIINFRCFAQNESTTEKSKQPIVRISSGFVQGLKNGDIESFKGIPYVGAPTGEFRWRPPQPAPSWKGIRDASKFCADCAQADWPRTSGTIRENTSEDCLFLNIWKPSNAKSDKKLPVMVWIYGGGFVGGSSSDSQTSGEQFAKLGVILINFNYRLGRLGHFAFPALSKENPTEPKGSYAYMDQIAALQWVKKNIAAFGGDPENVTIFGESAGGVSVQSLLTIPAAKGLFQKAIIESGGGRDGVLTGRQISKENADPYYPVPAETIGVNFARKHKIDGTDAKALEKLRQLSVNDIVDGGQEATEGSNEIIYSGPILDGRFVTETAESAYNAGRVPDIPIIIGSNSAEVPAGFVNARSKEELKDFFGEMKDDFSTVYDSDGKTEFAKILTLVNTDKVWAEPARFTARSFTSKKIPAYVYLFSYVPDALKTRMPYGASHASEIPYVFNNLADRNGFTVTEKEKNLSAMMNTYWANFAKTGNPNGEGLPIWSAYDSAKNQVFEFKQDGSASHIEDYRKPRLDVIEKAVTTKMIK